VPLSLTLRRAAAAAAAVLLPTLVLPALPADAASVSQTGYVKGVYDGDTVEVDIIGDGTSTPVNIRLAGIQAMELTHYSVDSSLMRGDCHAVEATKRLRALIQGKKVQVKARSASSMSGSRYRRTVNVYLNGAWRDVSTILLNEGHGLFLSNSTEYLPNRADATAAQAAAKKGIGLWDKDYCGSGPYQSAGLRLAVKWDADGNDYSNVNGEWIRIANDSSYAVPIGGWWVRDSAYRGTLSHGYVFPSTAKVPARGSVVVYVGKGTRTSTKFYWGNSEPIFENATGYPKYIGDGGYLFDPQGDMRAWQQYPCRYAC
jgi:endonuclease YncB( thermonuclease family)